jgi:hypothetical protein
MWARLFALVAALDTLLLSSWDQWVTGPGRTRNRWQWSSSVAICLVLPFVLIILAAHVHDATTHLRSAEPRGRTPRGRQETGRVAALGGGHVGSSVQAGTAGRRSADRLHRLGTGLADCAPPGHPLPADPHRHGSAAPPARSRPPPTRRSRSWGQLVVPPPRRCSLPQRSPEGERHTLPLLSGSRPQIVLRSSAGSRLPLLRRDRPAAARGGRVRPAVPSLAAVAIAARPRRRLAADTRPSGAAPPRRRR